MKNLISLNRSGMSPEVTCRKGRYSLDPILSRLCLASLICVLMLTIGVGNAWADYTVLFDADTSDEQTTLDGIVSTGSNYVSSVSASKTYMEGSGLRYGTSSAMGYTTFTMSDAGKVQATTITFKGALYYRSDNSSLSYTITYTDNTTTTGTIALSNSATDKNVSLTSTKTIKTIDIRKTANSNKRFYVKGFTITTAAPAAAATITLNNYDGSATTTGYHVGDSFTLPSTNNFTCGTKTFVGWSTVAVSSVTKPAANYYEPGTSVTLAASNTFYAVFADESSGGSTDGSKTLVSNSSSTYYSAGYITGSGTTTTATWTADAFTMTQNKNTGSNISLTYAEIRAYQYHSLVFTPSDGTTITSIVVTANTNAYATALGGSSISNCTKSVSSSTVTITPTDGTSAITLVQAAQSRLNKIVVNYTTGGGTTYANYTTTCCTDPGLNYGTGSVTKTFGNGTFKNTLTNSHSVSVTYESNNTDVATVASDGTVTIQGAGNATITARFAGNSTYCADEASYTLTVNKADISPTLTYTPNSVAVGENTSAPTVGANPGSGGVTYAITSATPSGCATINTSTGVVSGVAVGSVTVTATVAATTNYNGGTATANVTIHAASYFTNGATVFVQAESSSAWDASACVKAWFNASGAGGAAQTTYWLFDASGGGDDGKKLYATIVPASGDLNQVTLQRFTSNCSDFWNNNGTLTKASDGGSNTFRSTGSGTSNVAWNGSGMTLDLKGDPNSWGSSLGTFADQGNGVWTATYSNYAPADAAGESQEFKISTNYNGWIGNTGSNNNATLDGMHVGSTYNITATLDVKDHSLTMSKTFVKGTVHFNLQGHGSAISDLTNVAAGSKISAPSPAPSVTGWDFGGWYKEAGCTNAWNFASDEVNETVTLYAKWTAHEYTITKTLTNVTSSPAIPSTYTYTGAAAGLNYTITPSDGYRLPTEITVSGTTYTWNPATGALALTGTISSNVTITIVAVQTHTVDWYVGGSAPANKIGDDGQTTVVDHGGKISDFPATTPDGSPCDKEFVGWTNTSSYVHGTSPLFNDVAGSPTIDADANFYAVFATGGSTTVYLTESEISTSFVSGTTTSYGNYTITSASGTWGGKITINKVTISATDVYCVGIRKNADNNSLGSPTFSGNISNITVTGRHNAGSARDIYICSSNATAQPTSGDIGSGSIPAGPGSSVYTDWTDVSITPTGDHTSFYIYANGGLQIKTVAVTYGGYSGYTITCADCGTSVTPTYTAAPTGGIVSVTKNAAAVASGSTVKTCTSQDLTVTLTPATHYDLTGFTATGLTTGTATITPAVGSTLPVSVAQTFTVTVSAGATGTLTLAPTFTAQTPLSITLETHSKGTFTPIGDIYSGESFTFPDVTPNDPSCATFVGWIEGTTFVGDGTTHDAPVTIAAGSSSGAQSSNTTYTAVFYETETSESDAYVKVTAAPEPPATWANDHYLIVYEDAGNSYTNAVAFAGSRDNGDNGNIDATSNGIAVTIVGGNTIAATSTLAANEWRIASVTGGYSVQSASGFYIGRAANSNGIDASNSEAYVNTLGYSDSRTNITSAGGKILKYNTAGDQLRFRYLTSAGDIQLYKLGTAVVETRTYTTNPSCTPKYRVTVASVTGGSPSADPKFNPESTTVTITANPSAGYSFTSWTITKTTGGDNVTSTLLTGDKPTTANTTFTMPAYDITIAATYAKKMVTELKVMDDETVVANTTGPVSGTLNVSTGANKTLDVVITPSDAFDHSWTASVTAGGTYASITNVTDDGFRVNGLAQGDATITVNAPNDGSAKSVTLTVHVTDVLPEEIILKRDGSSVEISELTMYYDATNTQGQYVKVNVSYSPTPTNKNFTFSSAATGKVSSHSHSNANGYEVLVANGVTTDPVNCTFTSAADGSVTKVLAVTVVPILKDVFIDYVHGNATQTVSARLSADRYDIITEINTPSLSDASDAEPASADCETSHYHLIGWLPQATAEALWAAGTAITEDTEGLVKAGVQVDATGQTWYAIWGKEL